MKPWRELDAMQASMVAADDSKVAQIVALVDSMRQRGPVDHLMEPLRPRLAKLRPLRPVGFTRLLFTPLDSLIVPAPAWRRGGLSVPRTALTPIANALRDALSPEAAQLDSEGRAGAIPQARLTALSATLWPRAAALLESTEAPPGWVAATGLPDSDYPAIAATMTVILAVAIEIQVAFLDDEMPPEAAIRTILGRTAPRGGAALSAVVVVLLARLAEPGLIVALGTEAAGCNPSLAMDNAVEHTLDMLQASLDAGTAIGTSLNRAILDAGHIADLLQAFEAGAAVRPLRKRRIDRLRRSAEMMCRSRFESALHDAMTVKLAALPANPADETVEILEDSARCLRRLAGYGRRLGETEAYDGLLRRCIEPLRHTKNRLPLADRVRLVEILVGSQDALALLR